MNTGLWSHICPCLFFRVTTHIGTTRRNGSSRFWKTFGVGYVCGKGVHGKAESGQGERKEEAKETREENQIEKRNENRKEAQSSKEEARGIQNGGVDNRVHGQSNHFNRMIIRW